MKSSHLISVAAALAALIICIPDAMAGGRSVFKKGSSGNSKSSFGSRDIKRPSGGGFKAPSVSRPSRQPQQRPSFEKPDKSARPSFGRPSGGSSGMFRPQVKPAERPALNRPQTKPVERPSINKPQTKPAERPSFSRPETKPAERPSINRPGTKPAERPGFTKPETKPGERPSFNRPGQGGGDKPFINLPNIGDKPGSGINRPGDRPGFNRPGNNRPDGNRPGGGIGTGNRPGGGNNININRPGHTKPVWRPSRPDGKPGRPNRDDTFINTGDINIGNNFHNRFDRLGGFDRWQNNRRDRWSDWSDKHRDRLDDFRDRRDDLWKRRRDRLDDIWDHRMDRRKDWLDWRKDVWDFRMDRADDIRDFVRDSHCHWFTPNWYRKCHWWHGGPIRVEVNPWWWWRPVVWSSWAVIWGATQPPPPVVYDYGTDIVIRKEIVYVDGKETAPAAQYRQEAIALATPAAPPPAPVPASDDDTSLIPLGVWALVQEDKGDAVMFYQLTATKDGLITGAYSNALTGESAPVTGSIDKATQRIAFRTGTDENTGSVIECNMNSMTADQAGVFVHFGTGQTQEWLLVKMPNPDMPDKPTPVNTTPPSKPQ